MGTINILPISNVHNYISIIWESISDLILIMYMWIISRDYEFVLSNREKASLIIIFIFILIQIPNLFKKSYVKSVLELLKSIWGLFNVYFVGFCYLFVMISILYKFGFWKFYLTKDSFVWILTYFSILMIFPSLIKSEHWLRKVMLQQFRITILVEFIVSSYTMSLFWELIVLSFLIIITITEVFEDKIDNKYTIKQLKIIINLIIIYVAFYGLYIDLSSIIIQKTFRQFFLPIVLTFSFIPHTIYFALYVAYDHIFHRLDLNKYRSRLFIIYIKYRVIKHCRFNTLKIYNLWSNKNHILLNAENRLDLEQAFMN